MQQGTPDKHNFYEQTKKANQVNRKLKQIKKRCVKQSERWCDTVLKKTMIQNLILYKNHHFWISESIITELLQFTHNESFSDYQRQDWIRSQIESYYYWSILYYDINCYIFNCIICKHIKAFQQRSAGLLHLLEISQKCWQDLFCNFIIDLSELKDMNTILTVVDKLLKKQHYIPCHIKNR